MKIVIIGSGAMGLLFYRQLSKQHQVSLWLKDRERQQNSFAFNNLHGLAQEYRLELADPKNLLDAELIITTVKAYDVKSALSTLNFPQSTPLLLMHNGMGTYEQVSDLYSNPMMQMLTTQASKKLGAFHIQHTGMGVTQLGCLKAADLQISRQVFDDLKACIPNLQFSEQIAELQWKKLAVNCAINPLTAIENVNNGVLASNKYVHTINDVLDELITVAMLEGIKLNKAELKETVYSVIELTQRNSSSMRQDVLHQRKTEIDFINGYIVKLGQKHNVPTPVNAHLHQAVSDL